LDITGKHHIEKNIRDNPTEEEKTRKLKSHRKRKRKRRNIENMHFIKYSYILQYIGIYLYCSI